MTPEEMRSVAHQAAEEAVNRTFLHLGIDLEANDVLSEMRKDFTHLRSWRESTDTVKKHGLLSAVTVVTAGFCGVIWLGLKGG